MIPVKALISMTNTVGPEQLDRYNGFLAAKVLGNSAPGVSSGPGDHGGRGGGEIAAAGLHDAWTGQAFQEKRIGTAASPRLQLSRSSWCFSILSANYERWALPAAVLLAVPFGLFGALAAVVVRNSATTCTSRSGSWC